MADLMQFDLVSPERKLASYEATMVQIPGGDGDFAAMANHVPTVSSLRAGLLRVTNAKGEIEEYIVSGGFAEISEAGTSILAERALPKAEASPDFLAQALSEAEAAAERVTDDPVAKAEADMAVNDIKFLQSQLG